MDQARVEKYAGWLVQNKDKKGTKEFETVASAYKALRSGASDTPEPNHYNLSDVPAAALANAPADAGQVAINLGQQAAADVPTSGPELMQKAIDFTPLGMLKKAGGQVVDQAKQLYNDYNSWDKTKTRMAEHPVATALDAASVLPLLPGGLRATRALGKGATSLNKLKVTYPDAATSVAADLKASDFNLGVPAEANKAVANAHSNIKTEIKSQRSLFKDELNPNTPGLTTDQVNTIHDANKGLDASQKIASTQATPAQISALDSLVGDTKQGAQLVHNLQKHVEVQRLNNKPTGGISQYTDALSPSVNGRLGIKSAMATALTGANVVHAAVNPALGVPMLAAQLAAPVVGHMLDKITGRRITAQKLANDFGKTPPPDIGQGLTDVVAANEAARVAGIKSAKDASDLQQQQAAAASATKAADKQATADAKQEYKNAALENTQFNIAKAAAAKKTQAQVAADKLKAAQAAPPKKVDLGINQVALNMVHQKMKANAAALQKSISAANKVQNKAAAAAIGPKVSKAPKAAASAENAPVRNQAAYDRGTAHIQGQEAAVEHAIKGTSLTHLKALLAEGKAQLGSHGLRGRKHHKQRMAFYAHHLKKAHTKHERTILNKVLKPLAHTFE